jgi:hypothetical protein
MVLETLLQGPESVDARLLVLTRHARADVPLPEARGPAEWPGTNLGWLEWSICREALCSAAPSCTIVAGTMTR